MDGQPSVRKVRKKEEKVGKVCYGKPLMKIELMDGQPSIRKVRKK